MTRLLDLREVVPEDITVVFPNGDELRIPGDPPMEIYVQLLDLQERTEQLPDEASMDEQRELLDSVFDPVYDLFAFCQPELVREDFRKVIGVAAASAVLAQVMVVYSERGVEAPARPTTASARSGRRGASASKRTKSRS